MNTDIFINHSKKVRLINLAVFILFLLLFFRDYTKSIAIYGFIMQSTVNLIGQISLSIKYQQYDIGPISSPFMGSELTSFTVLVIALLQFNTPLNQTIAILLSAGIFIFLVSSTISYLWLISTALLVIFSAIYLRQDPYSSVVSIAMMLIVLTIIYLNDILIDKSGNLFLVKTTPTNISVNKNKPQSELVYGQKRSDIEDEIFYCRIPLSDNKWVTIKDSSKEGLKDKLNSNMIDGSEEKDQECIICNEEETLLNTTRGIKCRKTTPISGEASKTRVCNYCTRKAFKNILEDDSIDLYSSEDYISKVL